MNRASSVSRAARPQDAEDAARIESAWPTAAGWTAAQLRQEAEDGRALFFVCEREGRVCAYALARAAHDEAQIVAVGVEPSLARQGFGRSALSALLDAARGRGLRRATLEVSAVNTAAQALYLSTGFHVVGRRPKFYNDGSDAILMDLPL